MFAFHCRIDLIYKCFKYFLRFDHLLGPFIITQAILKKRPAITGQTIWVYKCALLTCISTTNMNGRNWGAWSRKLAHLKTDQTLGTWTRFRNARHFLSGKRNPQFLIVYMVHKWLSLFKKSFITNFLFFFFFWCIILLLII